MSIRQRTFAAAVALLALLAVPHAALAQAKPDPAPAAAPVVHAKPALWVVKDKDTTIYLFGTIHLLKPGINWFEGQQKQAFDSAQELVLEIAEDADPATQIRIAQRGLSLGGPALSAKLPEEIRPEFARLLTAYQLPTAVVDRMKPWLAAITLTAAPLAKLGYDPANGVEVHLRKAARAQNKSVQGLETAEEQVGFFDALSEPVQIGLLVETIREQETIEESLDKMVGAWVAGDPVVLAEELNKSMEEANDLRQVLLIDRNKRWAEWIKKRLAKPGTVFMAVGAGHLAGKGSVQDALKARRIKATLVTAR